MTPAGAKPIRELTTVLEIAIPVSAAGTAAGGALAGVASRISIDLAGAFAVAIALVAPAVIFARYAPQWLRLRGLETARANTFGRIVAFALPAAAVVGTISAYCGIALSGFALPLRVSVVVGIAVGYLAGSAIVCSAAALLAAALSPRPAGKLQP